MKVIIKDSGEVKTVPVGYAVNFLLPRGLAVAATAARLEELKQKQAAVTGKKQAAADADRQQAERLDGKVISFSKTSGKSGKIHGGITKKDIAAKLKILKTSVVLAEPIKKVGEYEAELKFGHSRAKVRIKVVAADKE